MGILQARWIDEHGEKALYNRNLGGWSAAGICGIRGGAPSGVLSVLSDKVFEYIRGSSSASLSSSVSLSSDYIDSRHSLISSISCCWCSTGVEGLSSSECSESPRSRWSGFHYAGSALLKCSSLEIYYRETAVHYTCKLIESEFL